MEYRYLVRKNMVMDFGLKSEINPGQVILFDNITIKESANEVGGKKVILVTEKLLNETINKSLVGSHKQIRGEITVANFEAIAPILAEFNLSHEITLDGGEKFSVADSQTGDIIFFAVTDTGLMEEAIVGKTGNMAMLTTESRTVKQLGQLDSHVVAMQAAIETIEQTSLPAKANKTEVYAKTETYSKNEINTSQALQDEKRNDLEERIKAIEDAEFLSDIIYKYDGVLANQHLLADGFDAKTLNANFVFNEGRKSTLAIQRISTGTIVSHDITASATAVNIEYSWAEDNGKLITVSQDINGILHVTWGQGVTTTNYRIFEVIQVAPQAVLNTGYTKAEADNKYALKVSQALQTVSKDMAGAINELLIKINANAATAASATGLKVDQSAYDTKMTEIDTKLAAIPTSFITLAEVNTAINAAIAAAFNTIMSVTFSDDTTDAFKINK